MLAFYFWQQVQGIVYPLSVTLQRAGHYVVPSTALNLDLFQMRWPSTPEVMNTKTNDTKQKQPQGYIHNN